MRTEQVKNWLKAHTDTGGGIFVGTINADLERCLGVYLQKRSGPARVCIGGAAQTKTDVLPVSILVHWGQSSVQAEAKAAEIWQLFYTLQDVDMDGAQVAWTDPGAGPIPLGRDARGVFEFTVNVRLIFYKE